MGWLIQHRFLSLALVFGIFKVLHKHLVGDGCVQLRTAHDLSEILKPQSNSRAKFWQSVVSYANEFLLANDNASLVTELISAAIGKEAHLRSSQSSQDYTGRRSPSNSDVKEVLGGMASEMVLKFFEALVESQGLHRGEVYLHICG
jgi:hypothetical protein